DVATLAMKLPKLREAGFKYLCVLDVENRHNLKSGGIAMLKKQLQGMLRRSVAPPQEDPGYAAANSAMRQYCDPRFPMLFDSPHAVLYSLQDEPSTRTTTP